MLKKVLALFAHGIAFEWRHTACYQPNWVAAGVGINTEKSSLSHFSLLAEKMVELNNSDVNVM
ncbi:hypothetical protein JCM18905_1837 [Vibrio sp. JCM 18905]|jgi:hypothetical protein|nr:hypothetical protein JCM18905_1837 [Vibrio sp. JCM 18905]